MNRQFGLWIIVACIWNASVCTGTAQVTIADGLDQSPIDVNVPRTYLMNVDRAPAMVPALKIELIPSFRQRRPGNAVMYYYRALLITQSLKDSYKLYAENEKIWLEKPLAELPLDSMESWLVMHTGALGELKEGTRREYCDWDLRPQDLKGTKTVEFLLPEIQDARQLARILRVKCRWDLGRGKVNDAIETLQMGYQLGHDVGKAPFLVSSLVGMAICQVMNECLLEVIAASDSPNLYWAVTALPRPLVDMRPGLESERRLPEQIFPWLVDAANSTRSREEWQRVFQEAVINLRMLESASTDNWESWLNSTTLALRAYPVAKQELITAGMDAKRVEEMPVGQVLAIQASQSVNYCYDELFKLVNLPYPEFMQGARQSLDRLEQQGQLRKSGERMSIASLLLPGLVPAMNAVVRVQRDLDAIRVIEALRIQAAASGQFPGSLADIKDVPIPMNPVNGQTFGYKVEGDKAILDVPPMPDQKPGHSGKRFVLQLRK